MCGHGRAPVPDCLQLRKEPATRTHTHKHTHKHAHTSTHTHTKHIHASAHARTAPSLHSPPAALAFALKSPPIINYRLNFGSLSGGSVTTAPITSFVNFIVKEGLVGMLLWPKRFTVRTGGFFVVGLWLTLVGGKGMARARMGIHARAHAHTPARTHTHPTTPGPPPPLPPPRSPCCRPTASCPPTTRP